MRSIRKIVLCSVIVITSDDTSNLRVLGLCAYFE